jgi:hypothetical protein
MMGKFHPRKSRTGSVAKKDEGMLASSQGGSAMTDTSPKNLLLGFLAAAIAVVTVTAAVLVVAVLLTPGCPDCTAYIGAAKLLCPWYRELFGNAALLFGVLVGAVVVVGYPIRLLRELLEARR